MDLSVVICTHNPRLDYLGETLDALKGQTLSKEGWELLIVDNASDDPLTKICDLEWHPHSRIVREDELGLMHARMRAIRETGSDLLVFVDDDNLLKRDYLEAARTLAMENPWLGTFGAACITPHYEEVPAPEFARWCNGLALREEKRDIFSSSLELTLAIPFGAGMCVRRSVAEALAAREARSTWRVFGRSGQSLMSAEDSQFSIAAADCGMGYGIFAALSLTHLIPARRVQLGYLLNIHEAMAHSNSLLGRLRSRELGNSERSSARELVTLCGAILKIIRAKGVDRKFSWRSLLGQWKALRDYRRLIRPTPDTP